MGGDTKLEVTSGVGAGENLPKLDELDEGSDAKRFEEALYIAHVAKEQRDEIAEGTGGANDYAKEFESFLKNSESTYLFEVLEMMRSLSSADSLGEMNYENWPNRDPEAVSALLHEIFPSKKGRKAFIEGLKLGAPKEGAARTPEEQKKFEESKQALSRIVASIQKQVELKEKSGADASKQLDKAPVPDVMSTGIKTLYRNWERGTGLEKAMILGAIGIALYIFNEYKDRQVIPWWKGGTPKNILTLGAGFWMLNFLSGKVAKDGKTVLQRVDFTRTIDNMDDKNVLKAFGVEAGMDQNAERYRAFVKLQEVDVKDLYLAYRKAEMGKDGKRTVDVETLGFNANDLDGGAVYQIIDKLVRVTGINREEEKKKIKLTPTQRLKKMEEDPSSENFRVFEQKYLGGALGGTHISLKEAIFYEYRMTDWMRIIGRSAENTLPSQGIELGRRGVATGVAMGSVALSGAEETAKSAYQDAIKPGGEYLIGSSKKAASWISEATGLSHWLDAREQKYLAQFLPADLTPEITADGKMKLMGYLEVSAKRLPAQNGKEAMEVDGLTFVAGNQAENAEAAAKLRDKAMNQVEKPLKEQTKGVPGFEKARIEFDSISKKWRLANVELKGGMVKLVGLEGQKLSVEILPGEKIDHASFEKNAIGDEVKKALAADTRFEKMLKGLDVEVTDVTPDPTHGPILRGKIAGLPFAAVLKNKTDFTQGINFYDEGAKKAMHAAEGLLLTQAPGAEAFLKAKTAQIEKSYEFSKPFENLSAIIRNTDEGILSRLNNFVLETKLGFIPWSVDSSAAVNGKILDSVWETTLAFKKRELLALFRQAAEGKPVDQIEAEYERIIRPVLIQLTELGDQIQNSKSEDRAELFANFLSGREKRVAGGFKSKGLELMNYTNPEYQKLFAYYKAMINGKDFNYAGAETFKDVQIEMGSFQAGAATEALEIYAILLSAWSNETRHYANLGRVDSTTSEAIRNGFVEEVRRILHRTQSEGSGSIKRDVLVKNLRAAGISAGEIAWGRGEVVEKWKKLPPSKKTVAPEAKEERNIHASIDPKNKDDIIKDMEKIFNETLPLQVTQKFNGPELLKYQNVLNNIAEAMVVKAIAENGTEAELKARFEEVLEDIRDKIGKEEAPWKWAARIVSDFSEVFLEEHEWKNSGKINPHIEGRANQHIKPQDKSVRMEELRKIDQKYEFSSDTLKEDQEFKLEKELPFYREFYVNRAVAENHTSQRLCKDYEDAVKMLVR